MPGISDCVGCLFGSPSRFGLSISISIKKEWNIFPLMSDKACFGPNGLISDRSSAYLGWTKEFWIWEMTHGGKPHTIPIENIIKLDMPWSIVVFNKFQWQLCNNIDGY